MSLVTMESLFILLGGELLGDGVFFGSIYCGQRKGAADEKRKQMLMPLGSLLFSVGAISWTLALPKLCNILGMWIFRSFSFLRPFVKSLSWLLPRICNCGIFSQLSYIAVFIGFYSWARQNSRDWILSRGDSIIKSRDEFGGIYVRDSLGTKYVLSEKWETIYHYICYLIFVDIAILAGIHMLSPNTVKNILDVELVDMIPLAILVFLMEVADYLSAEERAWWQWLMRKKDEQAADCNLNIIRLKCAITKYAAEKGINILKRRYAHKYDFPRKTQEYLDKWRNERDAGIQYLLDYIETETAKRFIPLHSIDSAIRLTKGENLYVANWFYKDLDVSIFFPIFMALLRGEKALIIVEDNGNLKEIVDWVRRGVEDIQDLPDFWVVEELRPMVDSVDVGVLAFQEICEEEALKWCQEFMGKVSFVVILEASNLLAGGQDLIMALASRVGKNVEKCTWLLTDHNAESMIDLYSHLLDKEFVYVSATPFHSRDAMVVYLDVEGESIEGWPPAKRYLGVEAAIAEIAGRENVGKIYWYGEEVMPVRDLFWIWGQYYKSYQQRIAAAVPYQMLFEENVKTDVSGIGNSMQRQQFIVTEDECFNLFEKGRQYSTRGLEKSFICILSPNYMLRDFMKAKYRTLEADAKYIPQFAMEHVDSRRNIALRILRRLLEGPVSHTEIIRILEKEEQAKSKISVTTSVLKEKVEIILPGIKGYDINITYQNCFSERDRQIEQEVFYHIIDDDVKKEFLKQFSQAVYIDELGEVRHISKMILGEHLDQKFEKGQFVVFDGKYFEIIGKTVYNNVQALLVKRASDQICGRRYYRICRKYDICFPNLPNSKCRHIIVDDDKLEIVRMSATLKARSTGYYELNNWNNIKGARKVELPEKEVRVYPEKQILGINLKEKNRRVALLMAAFLKEAFCTLYPQFYHLLDVVMDYGEDSLSEEKETNDEMCELIKKVISEARVVCGTGCEAAASSEEGKKQICSFYIVEDSREDMGLLRSIERNIKKIMQVMQDYMIWSLQSGRNYFKYDGS